MPDFLSLAAFKVRARIDHTIDDALCTALLDAAESYLGDVDNGVLRRPIAPTEFVESFDGWDVVKVAHPDEITAAAATYTVDDVETVYGAVTVNADGTLESEDWPDADKVQITYTAGFASVPAPIVNAGYYLAHTFYEARHAEAEVSEETARMIALMVGGYRRVDL